MQFQRQQVIIEGYTLYCVHAQKFTKSTTCHEGGVVFVSLFQSRVLPCLESYRVSSLEPSNPCLVAFNQSGSWLRGTRLINRVSSVRQGVGDGAGIQGSEATRRARRERIDTHHAPHCLYRCTMCKARKHTDESGMTAEALAALTASSLPSLLTSPPTLSCNRPQP
jgi:hypothetical protein